MTEVFNGTINSVIIHFFKCIKLFVCFVITSVLIVGFDDSILTEMDISKTTILFIEQPLQLTLIQYIHFIGFLLHCIWCFVTMNCLLIEYQISFFYYNYTLYTILVQCLIQFIGVTVWYSMKHHIIFSTTTFYIGLIVVTLNMLLYPAIYYIISSKAVKEIISWV